MQLSPITVLAIDDELIVLKVIKRILRLDVNLITAGNVSDALEIMTQRNDIEVILLDINMPERDGISLLGIIREMELYRSTPIILMSGDNSEDTQLKGLNRGASDFISKPFSPAMLRVRVQLHAKNSRLSRQLEDLAFTDSLTGLKNRRGLELALQREIDRCNRVSETLSVVLLDIDWFKKFNDTYGHAVGDIALQTVANVLEKNFKRATDIVSRLGGEEFVIVNTGLSAAEMQERLLQCREAVKAEVLYANDQLIDRRISLSAGGISIQFPIDVDGDMIIDKLLHRADTFLYKAKVNRDTQCWTETLE